MPFTWRTSNFDSDSVFRTRYTVTSDSNYTAADMWYDEVGLVLDDPEMCKPKESKPKCPLCEKIFHNERRYKIDYVGTPMNVCSNCSMIYKLLFRIIVKQKGEKIIAFIYAKITYRDYLDYKKKYIINDDGVFITCNCCKKKTYYTYFKIESNSKTYIFCRECYYILKIIEREKSSNKLDNVRDMYGVIRRYSDNKRIGVGRGGIVRR